MAHKMRLAIRQLLQATSDDTKKMIRWSTLLIIVMLMEKQILAYTLLSSEHSLGELGFGFGNYISSLLGGNGFVNCVGESGHCEYASRMPFLPILMAGFGLISDNQLIAAWLKNALMSLLTFATVRHILQIPSLASRSLHIPATLLIACLSPPLLKHAAHVTYEEGLLIELLMMWLFYFAATIQLNNQPTKSPTLSAGCLSPLVFLATAILLTKSSMILLWLLTIGLLMITMVKNKNQLSKSLVISLIGSAVLIGSWGWHVHQYTGRFSIMSTYDGSNIYRAWNHTALAIYPQVSLDRVIDTAVIIRPDGVGVTNALKNNHPSSLSEDDWNKGYRAAGVTWIKDNPADAIKLLTRKMENFFFSIEKTPYMDMKHPFNFTTSLEYCLIALWLVAGRIGEILILLTFWRKKYRLNPATWWLLLALASYAVPYVVGFNYERHITPFLLMTLTVLVCLHWGLADDDGYLVASNTGSAPPRFR